MGYRRMNTESLYEIFKRWHNGQSISKIAFVEGRDRKTIRNYIAYFKESGYFPGCKLPSNNQLLIYINSLIPKTDKKSPLEEELSKYIDEIGALVTDDREPVKIKTAYEIIKHKYNWRGSYESFKIFIRRNKIKKRKGKKDFIRIELPPGREIQIDYGKVGLLKDHKTGNNKVVYAFCGILSNSRLPYIEFCYTQKEESFTHTNINMFEFYAGVTDFVSLDNLKSGVIKPDIYDPKINKSFGEMAEYYGIFIDPCRVATPTDKGKVERIIPLARELFRKLKNIYPLSDLNELNKHAKKWCSHDYGEREHGTTGIPPIKAYENEKKYLKELPEKRFEVCVWKSAAVHPDQFFSFEKKRYSLPKMYVGKDIWVKKVRNMVYIYHNYQFLRTYLIPEGYFAYKKEDFPEVLREMMDGGYPKYLLGQAMKLGENAYKLIESMLTPHAYLNARRAQGSIEVLKKYIRYEYFDEVCGTAIDRGIKIPKTLRMLFEADKEQKRFDFSLSMSELGKQMVRDIDYYWT